MFSKKSQDGEADKRMVEDVVRAQQNLLDGYNREAADGENTDLYEDLLNILREEHDIYKSLQEEMLKRGWRSTESAASADVRYIQARFSEIKQTL